MPELWDIVMRVPIIVGSIILLTRLHGLRSFSKMSGFDFAITVSIGSILAGAITTPGSDLMIYLGALAALYLLQMILAQSRARAAPLGKALDNPPLLVMEDGTPLDANLKKAGMTRADLWAKLREANAFDLARVHAVVVESTGDVSVLHGDPEGPPPDSRLLEGVRR